ncbi:MAG: DUF4258 domain-containing protein [Armatimonadetes bacterium]|nr:DUF4258 domain-containing protein [Armatimonadota bacterium]
MSETLDPVKALVAKGEARVSDHGFDELAADGILVREVVQAVAHAELLEDYPDYPKGLGATGLGDGVAAAVVRGLAPPGYRPSSVRDDNKTHPRRAATKDDSRGPRTSGTRDARPRSLAACHASCWPAARRATPMRRPQAVRSVVAPRPTV